jgi:hypothetical protein
MSKADNITTFLCGLSRNSGSLPQPSGSVQAFIGIAIIFYISSHHTQTHTHTHTHTHTWLKYNANRTINCTLCRSFVSLKAIVISGSVVCWAPSPSCVHQGKALGLTSSGFRCLPFAFSSSVASKTVSERLYWPLDSQSSSLRWEVLCVTLFFRSLLLCI